MKEVGGTANGGAFVNVSPLAATGFSLAGGSGAIGVSRPITIIATDVYGNIATSYNGTVHVTSSDAAAILPADVAQVNGIATVTNGIANTTDLWGFSGTELYVVADSTVWRGDGAGNWTFEARLAGGNADFRSIWGDPGSGTLIVTGDNGRYMQRIGGVWSEPTFGVPGGLGVNLREVWGCSATQAWIGSSDGQIWNWTPGGATQDMNYTGVWGAWPIYAFAGTSCTDVWAGGPSNALFHGNGAAWDSLFVTGDQLNINALAYREGNAVYAGGEAGLMTSVTSTGTVVRMTPNSQGDFIRSLWRLDNGDLVVGADYTVMLGRR